jgi:hypothetical protein
LNLKTKFRSSLSKYYLENIWPLLAISLLLTPFLLLDG